MNEVMSREYPDSNALFDLERYQDTVRRAGKVVDILWGSNTIGLENIPESGAAIVDISHRSLLDPWLVAISVGQVRAVRGMAKEELLNWYYFRLGSKYLAKRGVFFVNRDKTSRSTWEFASNILRGGEALAMAEEGTHRINGPILGEQKGGVARLAVKMEAEGIPCPVVPVGMSTENLIWHLRRPVNFVIEKALRARIEPGATVADQRTVAKEFGAEVHDSLQSAFDRANALNY